MEHEEHLPVILDLQAATPLYQMLMAHRGVDLQISGAQVQRLGTQCLQILLSAQAAWAADAKTLIITEPSPELLNSVELFGLYDPVAVFGEEQRA